MTAAPAQRPASPPLAWVVPLVPALGLLAFDPLPFDWHAVKFAVLAGAAFACVGAAVIERRLAWTGASFALWAFVIVRACMVWHAPASGRAIRWLALLVALALAHHAAAGLATRAWLRRHAIRLLAACGGLVALYALVQLFGDARQASATFANRNFAGAGLAMLLPYALATRARWWLGALVLAGLAATTSRGGALAAAVALAVVFTHRRPRLRWLILLVPAAVLAAALALGEVNTVKVRRTWYAAAWHMGKDNLLVGVGADGFRREYPPVRPLEEHRISGGRIVHAVHNDYLESFAEGGLPGLLAHLFLLLAAARAVRRDRTAAASLAAFAAASLVDLPLRDPSLLALAWFGVVLGARRVRLPAALPVGAVALVACGALFPLAWSHYRADRRLGAYLRDPLRDKEILNETLAREPGHPEALLERGRLADLERLLAAEPNHGNARLRRSYYLPRDEMVPALREALRRDPHHVLTRVRLAELVMADDPLQAISLLEGAVRADPRPFRPYLMLARLHREGGRIEAASRYLQQAEARSDHVDVARERMEVELAMLRDGRVAPERFLPVVRRLPVAETRLRIRAALGRAQEIERSYPAPRFERREGETLAQATLRFNGEKARWRRERDALTALPYLEARLLAEALTIRAPTAEHYRLRAAAERDLDRARRLLSLALFLDTLDALLAGDIVQAERRFGLAIEAHPGLPDETNLVPLLRRWREAHPAAVPAALDLFAAHERLRRALGAPN